MEAPFACQLPGICVPARKRAGRKGGELLQSSLPIEDASASWKGGLHQASARSVSASDRDAQSPEPRLVISDVCKQFGSFHALSGVTFTVHAGEVHALLGANGAGKSTLIRILAGFYKCDSGHIDLRADRDGHSEPNIEFIHQDLALVGDLSVAENIALLRGYPKRMGRVSWSGVRRQAVDIMARVAEGINVDAKVADLTRAEQSLVAIARAISNKCSVLVLDEPTASLPDSDVNRLFDILTGLQARGISIIYVTHRLDEVRRISDRVTILRDGKVVTDKPIDAITDSEIVAAIVGGNQSAFVHEKVSLENGATILSVEGAVAGPLGKPVSFELRRGEILGLAGLRGGGHEEVGRAIAGIDPMADGVVRLAGQAVGLKSVRDAIESGIGFATSRREQEALAMNLTARENFFLNPSISKKHSAWRIGKKSERASAVDLASQVMLRPLMPESTAGSFSGGNQQKVVLGRWLNVELRVLILEDPTIGIDVGARAEIYGLIQDLAARGLGVIVISSDFEEMAMICGRVLAFDRGVITQEISGTDVSVSAITHAASGTLN